MSDRPETLREYRAMIVPACEVESVGIEDLGLRAKLAGVADQTGGQSRIVGPSFRKRMYFIAQIDSLEFKGKKNPDAKDHRDVHFMFGEVGMNDLGVVLLQLARTACDNGLLLSGHSGEA